jgi:hypothetical protein
MLERIFLITVGNDKYLRRVLPHTKVIIEEIVFPAVIRVTDVDSHPPRIQIAFYYNNIVAVNGSPGPVFPIIPRYQDTLERKLRREMDPGGKRPLTNAGCR